MASPFPGMDPYLENPELWPDVHHNLISQIRGAFNEKICPKYVGRIKVRVYLPDSEGPETRFTQELEEARIEILEVSKKRLVTVIEILSPSNKRRGSRGRKSLLEKRMEIMDSPSHWVEIDLLRTGVPTMPRDKIPQCDYMVHVSREHQRPKGEVWPIRLTDPLPVITVPLLPEDKDTTIDLREILRNCYQVAAYDVSIDYKADPVPPLKPEAAEWADALLREKGLR